MSKMSEMEATIRELRDIASSINDIANWLTGAFSGTEEAAPAPEPEKALTLEEVRAILAEKSLLVSFLSILCKMLKKCAGIINIPATAECLRVHNPGVSVKEQ